MYKKYIDTNCYIAQFLYKLIDCTRSFKISYIKGVNMLDLVLEHSNASKTLKVQLKKYREDINKSFFDFDYRNSYILCDKLIEFGRRNNWYIAVVIGMQCLARQEAYLLQYHKSIELMESALDYCKKEDNQYLLSSVYKTLGSIYTVNGNFESGLKYFNKSLEYHPDSCDTLNNLGQFYWMQNRTQEAIDTLSKALLIITEKKKQNRDDKDVIARIYSNFYNTYLRAGDYENAGKSAEKFYENTINDNSKILLSSYYCMKAKLSLIKEDYSTSEENLKKVIAIAEGKRYLESYKVCYYLLYEMYLKQGKTDKALECFKEYSDSLHETYRKNINSKIMYIQEKMEKEKEEHMQEQSMLLKSKSILEKKLNNLQTAYSEVTGIGLFGVFSKSMQDVVKYAELLHEDRSVPVLIEGETGTGKEIVARLIHYGRNRSRRPFIILNCAAISASLFESELFGYVTGAFTGAKQGGMAGKFELANEGTIFLDEIGELPLEHQAKLLRVIQQKEIFRIGAKRAKKIDVRIICATNRDLKSEMQKNQFRQDLYFRLNTGRISILPLRNRVEDILPLANMFIRKFAKLRKKEFLTISVSAAKLLEQYYLPGNVRELENEIDRITLLYNDKEIKPKHLQITSTYSNKPYDQDENYFITSLPHEGKDLREIKDELIETVLSICDNNVSKAARFLNVHRNTIKNMKG